MLMSACFFGLTAAVEGTTRVDHLQHKSSQFVCRHQTSGGKRTDCSENQPLTCLTKEMEVSRTSASSMPSRRSKRGKVVRPWKLERARSEPVSLSGNSSAPATPRLSSE